MLAASGVATLGLAANARSVLAQSIAPFTHPLGPRKRVLYVNDLAGDIDGLFATVHALLSPSIELRTIIGSGTNIPNETAARSVMVGNELLNLMGLTGRVKVLEGLASDFAPSAAAMSPGVQAIIDEAMRTDTKLPLYVTVGGGLGEVAAALKTEPRIAERMTLIWIGGRPIPGNSAKGEYNYEIDPAAAQYVFNETMVRIWQVCDAVYRTCMVSDTELQMYVAPRGKIGEWLYRKLFEMGGLVGRYGANTGETWTLGDSPLVLLTALTDWVPEATRPYERTGSSQFDEVVVPLIKSDGTYIAREKGRTMRAYRSVDTRLMLQDFFAKLAAHYRSQD